MKGRKEIYLFIGAPGSGKGSLAQKCVQELGWKQLSTGNLCRKHISEQTEIGKEIDFAIKSGKLVSDELVTAMVVDWLNQEAQNAPAVILDGYPRTCVQAQAFDQVLQQQLPEWKLHIIKLVVADETIVDRLCKRYVCQNKACQAIYSLDINGSLSLEDKLTCDICSSPLERREDDEPDTIRERLAIYHKHENALLQFYHDRGREIVELNVEMPLPVVFRDFKKVIGL